MNIDYLIESVKNNRTIIFDLDNTIFDENDFLSIAYDNISNALFPQDAQFSYNFLIQEFHNAGRNSLFDKLLDRYPNYETTLEECLYQLRNTNCKNCIDPYEWFKNFVNDAQSSDWRLKIITNGNPQQQMNKLKSLNLSFVANIVEVIFANEYKPKPMIDSYLKLRNVEKFIEPIYVGDSLLDQEFAHNCKIEFFDVNLIK